MKLWTPKLESYVFFLAVDLGTYLIGIGSETACCKIRYVTGFQNHEKTKDGPHRSIVREWVTIFTYRNPYLPQVARLTFGNTRIKYR